MIREVFKDIYLNEVILPKSPLKILNSYIVKGDDRALVIDTGFDAEESERIFFEGLDEAGVEIGKTDLFLTHLHADHAGLAHKFKVKYGGTIYSSYIDAHYINAMHEKSYIDFFFKTMKLYGIADNVHFFDEHPAILHGPKHEVEMVIVKENDYIKVGDYNLKVIGVPGHTPDQLNLYDEASKLYFSADHILTKITPNISFWDFKYGDILGVYLENLDKVKKFEIDIMLPGHRAIIYNHRERIDELKKHYIERNQEVYRIIQEKEELTPYEMASHMRWDYRSNSFEQFPNNQKWFAAGEAMANLEHLVAKDLITSKIIDGVIYYKKK